MALLEIPVPAVETDFTPSEARARIDAIKAAYLTWESQGFQIGEWIHLFEQQGGYQVLGYDSMEALIKAEFPDRAYTTIKSQLEAARVRAIVDPGGEVGTIPRHPLRALHPFIKDPETVKEAYQKAQDSNGKVTAKRVRDVINGMMNGQGASRKSSGTSRDGVRSPGPRQGTSGRSKGDPGTAQGPELTSSPKKAYATWEKFVLTVNNHHLWIREHGGILVHTKDWRPQQRTFVRENLRRFIPIFEAWVAELEEVQS